jgi:hypothetical protein
VDFVVIGGIAGSAHGSAYVTADLDVVYRQDRRNVERLARVLIDLNAVLRGAPPDVPFLLDAETIRAGANFTFETEFGSFDVLAYAEGAPPYDELRRHSVEVNLGGAEVPVASLDHLIAMKEAAGRPRDKLMASEYRVLADEIRASQL